MPYDVTVFVYEALVLLMYMTSNRNTPETNYLSVLDINKTNSEVQDTVLSCIVSFELITKCVLYK